ncbi:hypothetical protein E2C01_029171 [Portunus trituberculatus]|uniref:Uncharacterized protein n=1 Tax=Portunus trituberculatus TaxID=210409 RepID=A0A5B7ER91_PORTR|nr:hypothetical protein [Portunus trituberculatus]
MPSLDLARQRACRTPWIPTPSRASSPQPDISRRRVSFPEGHGKTLAQLYEWFLALLKQHPSLEPLMKESRRRPYLTVNPRSAAYDLLVKEGFLGFIMTPADPDARHQMHFHPSGRAAPTQSGAAQPPILVTATCPCATQDCPYASVVGAAGAAPALQADVPATLQDMVQLLLEIRAEVRDLNARISALESRTQQGLCPSQCPNNQPSAPTSICPGPACPR